MNHKLARTRRIEEEAEVSGSFYERVGQPRGQRTETQVSIRVASSRDRESLGRMFSRVSTKTIYLRFHIPYPDVPEQMLALMLDADEHYKQSLVAVVEDEVVGHAMYARLGDGGEAEMAIIVEDGYQSKGVGKLLLRKLAEKARSRSVETFVGTVLTENRRMLSLVRAVFADSGHEIAYGAFRFRASLRTLEPEELGRPLRRAPYEGSRRPHEQRRCQR